MSATVMKERNSTIMFEHRDVTWSRISEVEWHAYLDFLFTKSNTIDDEHSCCLVRLGIACVFGFQGVLILRAKVGLSTKVTFNQR
jgi:hypothetical protein